MDSLDIPILFRCVECDKPCTEKDIKYAEPVRTKLLNSATCHTCDHWMQILNYQGPMACVRVNGAHFMYDTREPFVEDSRYKFLGHGGRKWWIKFLVADQVIVSNNLWYQGEIPKHFLSRLPDNAVFLPRPGATEEVSTSSVSSSPASSSSASAWVSSSSTRRSSSSTRKNSVRS